jgi:UDP-N-acetyl-D-mannosaminuronic acid dehydrogenase
MRSGHLDELEIVIVGGCGHVGLPLGIALAACAGARVKLLDVSPEKIQTVNSGRMPFREDGADELLRQIIGRSLAATDDVSCISSADVVVTVVGTPVDRHLNPMLNELCKNIDGVVPRMKDGALLVLRSTVYPGVSQRVYEQVNELGRKIHVAFCPERITEGKARAPSDRRRLRTGGPAKSSRSLSPYLARGDRSHPSRSGAGQAFHQ